MAFDVRANLVRQLGDFLSDPTTEPEDIAGLENYLDARPKRLKAVSFVSDLERRMQFARDAEEMGLTRNTQNASLWAVLMIAPLSDLEKFFAIEKDSRMAHTILLAEQVPGILKTFLTKRDTDDAKKRTIDLERKLMTRSHRAKLDCLDRDGGHCVVTGIANPDVCHIWPFASLKDQEQTVRNQYILRTVFKEMAGERVTALLAKERNIVDTAQNLICLTPQLHRWWGSADLGLEPVQKLTNGVRIRLRWLPPSNLRPSQHMDTLQIHPSTVFGKRRLRINNAETNRLLLDGQIIDLVDKTVTDGKNTTLILAPDWDILSLQWDLVRMAALCGGAEAINEDQDAEDEEDEEDFEIAEDVSVDLDEEFS